MTTKQSISRLIIFLFLFLTGLWSHAIFILRVRGDIKKDDCSFDPDELFLGVAILEIIGNIFVSIAFIVSCLFLLNFDIENGREKDDRVSAINFCFAISFTAYFICSILTNITFFKSDYLSGKFETCSKIDAEIAFRLITFSFAWILFLFYTILAGSILYITLMTFGIAIKESNLFCCPDLTSCRKVRPIGSNQNNEKNIQTDPEIRIPISSLKNESKPFTCMICMSNMIDLLVKPCHHICICDECYKKLSKKNCPCCNVEINEVRTIYVSNLN